MSTKIRFFYGFVVGIMQEVAGHYNVWEYGIHFQT
jgi:hypothetical protein